MGTLLNHIYHFNTFQNLPDLFSHLISILGSLISGMLIGWERERSGKAAGLRTFALVSFGATIFTLVGREINGGSDVARIVAQIISGIGFIGAGAVFRDHNRVSGLGRVPSLV